MNTDDITLKQLQNIQYGVTYTCEPDLKWCISLLDNQIKNNSALSMELLCYNYEYYGNAISFNRHISIVNAKTNTTLIDQDYFFGSVIDLIKILQIHGIANLDCVPAPTQTLDGIVW